MNRFLLVYAQYATIDVGLYDDHGQIDLVSGDKLRSSKELIGLIAIICKRNHITLAELAYIAATIGPAPLTLLRVSLATVNGIHFATHIPLIGVNNLCILAHEYACTDAQPTVALLNAFSREVYYTFCTSTDTPKNYCSSIDHLLSILDIAYPSKQIQFIGNGTDLFKSTIKKHMSDRAVIPTPLPHNASIDALADFARNQAAQNLFSDQLLPAYLKKLSYKKVE